MHSRDLAKWDRISHYGSDGSNPWDRVKRAGYPAKVAAENVGTGQVDFAEVLRGWKDSPGHNKNLLLADANEMGLALVQDPKTEFKSFWTLVVGAPMDGAQSARHSLIGRSQGRWQTRRPGVAKRPAFLFGSMRPASARQVLAAVGG